MKRYVVLITIVMAVLIVAFNAFGQEEKKPDPKIQKRIQETQNMRERLQNMSPEQREKLRAQMEERRKKYQNMSNEERAKLRNQVRERPGSGPIGIRREDQIKAIKAIEAQVVKLKAAVEAGVPENREQIRALSQEDMTKLREKMMASMRERQMAIRAIEQELGKLKGLRRPPTVSESRLSELRAIHKLAVREKATQTADRLDKLIMGYQRGSVGRERPPREGQPRPRRERPARQEKTK